MACPFAGSNTEMPVGHPAVPSDTKQNDEIPIPQPPPSFLLGNLPDIDPSYPGRSFQRMADLYGEIYQLAFPGRRVIVISSERLANEVCNQDRFFKEPAKVLREIRALTGDGLFTSAHQDGPTMKREENWWKAHRLLVPAFGPLGLRKMFDDMQDISVQMMLRWDRHGDRPIDASDDFTRLAFDTIGLCGFGYRFNEFYSDLAHPFASQMSHVLKMSGARANRSDLQNMLHRWEEQERQDNVKKMHDLTREIVAERKRNPKPDAKDLLNTMLYSVDRESGETLSEDNIVYNMVTFLVAGHETTSATLSFMWYNLLKNPETFHKAQKQVDDIVGDKVVSLEHLSKLTYLDAAIKETLRMNSPIGAFGLVPTEDTTLLNGTYHIKKGDAIQMNLKGIHNDRSVWGDDCYEFKPERFLDGKFQALPPNSWKPFGNGLRACIGRGFAEQEMILNTAMILQRFSPEMVDPSYDLQIKSTLTIKPEGFFMRMRRRPGKSLLMGIPGGAPAQAAQRQQAEEKKSEQAAGIEKKKINIFFGGNSGTCEGFGEALATSLSERGIESKIANLDAATEGLSKDVANIIITASYEGQPPDNAKKFVSWLQKLDGDKTLNGIRYAVMGVGNSDWTSTFHRIPRLVDEQMSKLGAEAIVPAGYTDVKGDLIGPFEDWMLAVQSQLLSTGDSSYIEEADRPTLSVSVERSAVSREVGDDKMGVGTVLRNDELADNSVGPVKKHMEVRLPAGMRYDAGDYLVIQPRNPVEAAHKVMRYFGYDEQTKFSVQGTKKRFLPTTPTSIETFLLDHVELGNSVTKRQLKTIAGYAKDGSADSLATEEISSKLIEKRYSIIDVLIEHSITIPFEAYIDMLQPLTPRQYSISSSPLAHNHEDIASITYDVHNAPAWSGHGIFEGACSTFLASRRTGDSLSCFVRATNIGFRLPADTETPLLLFSAGTGIAPMRAFLQERAAIAEAGTKTLGPALLFFGSRDAEKDFLYKSELEEWQKLGVVTVHGAHSRMSDAGTPGHPKYVQDAIYEHRDQVAELFRNGGKIYLCGSAARLGQSCAEVCKKIWMEKLGKGKEEAEEWLESVKTDRYISDVY